jgi:ribonucleoside-diphosphate reductase alpha chain
MKAWKSGLKTGIYYLKSSVPRSAVKFTVKQSELDKAVEETANTLQCERKLSKPTQTSSNEPEGCRVCE